MAISKINPNSLGGVPAFSAYRGTNQTGLTSGVATKIQVNTKDYDTATAFDNVTNYRFQPTVAGYYSVTFAAYISGTNLSYAFSAVYKNGAVYGHGNYGSVVSGDWVSTGSAMVYLNGSTDYLELYAGGTVSSGTVTVIGSSATTRLQATFARGV